jgi:putative PIN family toxin of toxin-antitoxin system
MSAVVQRLLDRMMLFFLDFFLFFHIMGDMKIVIDTSVFVAGLRSNQGASHLILQKIGSAEIKGIISVAVLLEYEDVLKRPDNLSAFGMTSQDVDVILDMICLRFDHIVTHFLWRPCLKDADDDMLLELAVGGRAEAIVTHNVKHFKGVNNLFHNLKILTPKDYLTTYLKRRN